MRNSPSGMLGGGANKPAAPLNTYRPWRYALIVLIAVAALVYAIPNLYPPDYALQVSAEQRDTEVSDAVRQRALQILDAKGIAHHGEALDGRSLTIRVASANEQLRGQSELRCALSDMGNYVVALNLAPTTPGWLSALGARPMRYGLDLQGGVHLLLQVDMESAIEAMMSSFRTQVRALLREEKVIYRTPRVDGVNMYVDFDSADQRNQARALISGRMREFEMLDIDTGERPRLRLQLMEQVIRDRETYAVEQNLRSLRNRVNELGVSEPLVQRLGRDRIVVDLPGLQDSAEAKRILGKIANLDFRLAALPATAVAETESYPYEGRTQALERDSIVTGDNVTDAQQELDPETSQPQVSIRLDGDGGRRMFESTRNNVGHPMAILFNESRARSTAEGGACDQQVNQAANLEVEKLPPRLISVATIQSPLGNNFRITGLGLGEAKDLALLLRAGALAAPIYVVEERTVGASLGEDNVRTGLNAGLIGIGAVALFMIAIYRLFGLLANIALTLNVVLLIAVMSMFGVTLTLPGIAGIVLTIGMAVDANVLIFSRIREEMVTRSPQQAIQAGFDRALTTIIDSNVTTLIVAALLFLIGSGPIRGFALVLSIGILTSMFSAISVTRALVNATHGNRSLTKLSI